MGFSVVASADCDRHGRGDFHGRLCRPGITVDEGAIVGAGAIVLKELEPMDDCH
jgi:hypothetical protein